MTFDAIAPLHEAVDPVFKRRQHVRVKPVSVVALLHNHDGSSPLDDPKIVVDLSVNGIAILVAAALDRHRQVYLSILHENQQASRIPATIRSIRRVGTINRIGLEFDTNSTAYRLQATAIENIEMRCIEKAEF